MNQQIIKRAIKHYGANSQVRICQEENAELIQALSKFLRGKPDYENIAEEMADVKIMIAQLEEIFANADDVEMWVEFKLLRLQGRMDDELLNNDSVATTNEEELVKDCVCERTLHDYSEQTIQGVREGLRELYQLP